MTAPSLGIVADDLSGAAECASHALMRVSRSIVVLAGRDADATIVHPDAPCTRRRRHRGRAPRGGHRRHRLASTHRAGGRRARSAQPPVSSPAHPSSSRRSTRCCEDTSPPRSSALAEELQRTPVVAVANPALERVVRRRRAPRRWHAPAPTPTCGPSRRPRRPTGWPTALHPLATVLVPHPVVSRGVAAVAEALAAAADAGLVAVCDAVTDADLDVVHAAAVAASAARGRGTLLVGSGALADAAVRALPPEQRRGPRWRARRPTTHHLRAAAPKRRVRCGPHRPSGPSGPCSSCSGTRAPGVSAQLEQLCAARTTHMVLRPAGPAARRPRGRTRRAGRPRPRQCRRGGARPGRPRRPDPVACPDRGPRHRGGAAARRLRRRRSSPAARRPVPSSTGSTCTPSRSSTRSRPAPS